MNDNEEIKNDNLNPEEEPSWEEIGKDFKDGFRTILDTIFSPAPKKKMKWSAFVQELGNAIDEEALSHQKESGKTFLGGKCRFYGEKSGMKTILKINAEEYFQNPESEKVERRTVMRECSYAQFDLSDTETVQNLNAVLREPLLMNIDVPEQQEE